MDGVTFGTNHLRNMKFVSNRPISALEAEYLAFQKALLEVPRDLSLTVVWNTR